jgi:hypothetical protein
VRSKNVKKQTATQDFGKLSRVDFGKLSRVDFGKLSRVAWRNRVSPYSDGHDHL